MRLADAIESLNFWKSFVLASSTEPFLVLKVAPIPSDPSLEGEK
jgi:hypothetical protein